MYDAQIGIVARPNSALEDTSLQDSYGSATKQQLWVELTAHYPITWLCVSSAIVIVIWF
jgi:hypothetical protein